MLKKIAFFMLVATVALIADQYIKSIILNGFRWQSNYISIIYVLNDGVAFSMLSFLQGYLKFLQIGLLFFALIYVSSNGYLKKYPLELGLIFGSGASNIYDRFIHGGVVDYIYYHHWFEFAVFNLADMLIDLGVLLLIIRLLKKK